MTIDEPTAAPALAGPGIRAQWADVAGLARTGWRRLAGFAGTFVLLASLVVLVEGILLFIGFKLQASRLTVDGVVTWGGTRSMLLQSSVASVFCSALIVAGGASCAVAVAQRLRAGAPSSTGRSLRRGFRRTPVVLVSGLVTLAVFLLLLAATPLIVNVAALLLLLTPIQRRIARRRVRRAGRVDDGVEGVEAGADLAPTTPPRWRRWPSVRTLLVAVVPLGWVAVWATRTLLVLPAAVAVDGGVRATFTASARSVRGRVLATWATVLGAAAAIGAIQFGLVALVRQLDQTPLTVLVTIVATLITGVLLALLLTVAYHGGDVAEPTPDPEPGDRIAAAWRTTHRSRLATTALALALGGLGVLLPLVPASPSAAAAGNAFSVTSLGDAGDVDPGDGACATAAGVCTLRAAIEEGNTQGFGGAGNAITFAVSGTVTVGSPLAVQASTTIDGSGRRVVIDGGGTTQIFQFGEGQRWGLRALHVTNGRTDGGGGALSSGGPGVIDGVTFSSNAAVDGASGGAVLAYSSVTIVNSTFHANTAEGKGAAIFAGGSAVISHSTFSGSSGPVWADFRMQLDDSIIESTGGQFACRTFGDLTGAGNVGSDDSCPGVPASRPPLRLGTFGDHGGDVPTTSITADSPARNTAVGTCPDTDARSVPRPQGAACDAGAYELDVRSTTTLTVDPSPSQPGQSVRLTAAVASNDALSTAGNVTFSEGATTLGTSAVANGQAVLDLTSLASGPHTLTASYGGNGVLAPSTGTATHQVAATTTPVTISSSANPAALGAAVTFTVDLQTTSATPGGTVVLKDGATTLATLPVSSRSVTFTTSALGVGTHPLVATYGGDANHGAGTSPTFTQQIRGGGVVTLTAAPASVVFANAVTLTAKVTSPDAAPPTTGTVRFQVEGTFTDVTVDGTGTAKLVTSALPPGARTVYAQFLGGDGVGQSLSGSTTVTVTNAPTSVALTVTPAGPTDYGDEVTLAAFVTATGTPATVAGAIELRDGTTLLGQVPVGAGGRATLATTALGLGNRSITATFVPATGFATSTSPAVTHRVDAVGTVVTLISSTNPTVSGQAVTFTATVSGTGTSAIPTGSVSFRDGTTELGSVPLDATGAVKLDVSTLAVGSHAVTAVYAGATGFSPDTSPVVTQVVTKGATTVDLGAPALAAYGEAVTLRASVAPTTPATGVPTGTVTFTNGTTVLGTAPLVAGVATLVRNDLEVASYDVTATYGGSTSFDGSADGASFEVYRRATVLTLATDRPSSTYGEDVTLVATATTTAGIVPTGTVVFADQSGTIGSAPLGADGVARLTVDDIDAGTRSLDAFLDSTRFSAGFARTTLAVAKATPTAALTVSPIPVVTDQQSILTLDLTGAGGTKPSGYVTFTLDGNPLQRVLFANGKAELGTVLPIGTHRVRASYEGNANYEPTPLVTVVVEVGKYVPTLIVRADPADAVIGEPITLHAEVRKAAGKPAATGRVTFERDQQPIGAGAVDADGNVAITVSDLPLGTSTIAVRYEGDDRYAESRQDLEVRVTRPATVTTLTAATATPRVGQSVTYTATVTNPRSSVPPVGRLQLRRDGVLVAQQAVTPTGPSAAATFALAIDEPGDHLLVATFVPDGSQVLGSSSTVLTQAVSRYATATTVTGPAGPVGVGDSVSFTVAVRNVDAVDPGARSFRSQVVVSDGAGGTCTVSGGAGTCAIRITRPGPQTITATYAGDDVYAPSTGTLALTVGVGATRLSSTAFAVEGYPYSLVTGEPVRVSWTVGGPSTGDILVTTAGGRVWCRSTVEAGSCTSAFSLDELGSPVLTVAYAGTSDWSSATTTAGTGTTLSGCFPIRLGTTVAGRGTVAMEDGPNCGAGTGYREGSFATVVATPAPGFATEGFDPSEVARLDGNPNRGRFLVSRDGPATLQGVDVRFGFDCVSLTQTLRGPVDPGDGIQGSAACSNRPVKDQNGDYVSWWRRGTTASVEVRGAFARTDIQGRVRTPSDFQGVAYQLDDDSQQALGKTRYVLRYLMDDDRDSFLRFDAPCFTLGLTTSRGGGTASASGTNCTSALGAAGYAPTTPVTVTAKSTDTATFKEWTGGPDLPAGFSANGPVATFPIRSDSNVVATFTACYRLTTGIAGFPEDATLTVVTKPTCANGQVGWYAEGSDVDLTWRTGYFAGWATDQPSSQRIGTGSELYTGTARFRMDRDKAAMLKAPNPRWCSTLAVTIEPKGAGTGTVEGLDDPAYPCPAGQYAQSVPLVDQADPCLLQYLRGMDSNPERSRYLEELYVGCTAKSTFKPKKERRAQPQDVQLKATADAGDPLLGWSYETSTPPWADDPTREAYGLAEPRAPREDLGSVGAVKDVDIYGATTATAWVCQQIDAKVALKGPNGDPKGQVFELGSEYIAVDPPPNCPIAANAWTVGTKVRLAPSAPEVGYTFEGWTGAYTGPNKVVELELDGSSPSVRLDASYSVTCYRLGRTPRVFTSVSVEPNCPDPDPVGDWYIGGTRVGLTIKDRGSDFVFRGWSGAAGNGNPTYVVMDAERSVTANWTEKNGFEKAIDWVDNAASTVGTFLSDTAVAYADAMQEAGKVMIAVAGKAVQIGWGMLFDQTFGAAALPLNALRLINLVLGNDDLATVIDQYEKVLGITNMPGMLLGCATDSILGLLPPKDPTARDIAIQAGTDAKEIGTKLYELSKTAEELQKAQEKAKTSATRHLGPATAVIGLGYGVGTSLAEGRILTAQPELNDTVKACIEDSMPTELMDAVGSGL